MKNNISKVDYVLNATEEKRRAVMLELNSITMLLTSIYDEIPITVGEHAVIGARINILERALRREGLALRRYIAQIDKWVSETKTATNAGVFNEQPFWVEDENDIALERKELGFHN